LPSVVLSLNLKVPTFIILRIFDSFRFFFLQKIFLSYFVELINYAILSLSFFLCLLFAFSLIYFLFLLIFFVCKIHLNSRPLQEVVHLFFVFLCFLSRRVCMDNGLSWRFTTFNALSFKFLIIFFRF